MESVHCESVPCGSLNPRDVKESKRSTANHDKCWVPEISFIYPIRCRKIHEIQNVTIIFEIGAKIGENIVRRLFWGHKLKK